LNLGILGTGLMGSSLAKCLVNKGYSVVVYNRSRWKAERLSREVGVEIADTPRDLVERVDVAIAFIAGDEALYDIVYGENGVAKARGNSLLINASTVTPMASLRVYKYLKRHGIRYLEAPVYGSTSEAMECRLLSIVAGEESTYRSVEDLVEKYSSRVYYVGSIPNASVVKLALNNIGLAIPALLAESLALLKAWGIDPGIFRRVSGELWFGDAVERYWKRIMEGKPPRFKVWMAGKDYWYIAQSLKAKRLPSNLSETISSMYMEASAHGYGDKDYPLIARYYMDLVEKAGGEG